MQWLLIEKIHRLIKKRTLESRTIEYLQQMEVNYFRFIWKCNLRYTKNTQYAEGRHRSTVFFWTVLNFKSPYEYIEVENDFCFAPEFVYEMDGPVFILYYIVVAIKWRVIIRSLVFWIEYLTWNAGSFQDDSVMFNSFCTYNYNQNKSHNFILNEWNHFWQYYHIVLFFIYTEQMCPLNDWMPTCIYIH